MLMLFDILQKSVIMIGKKRDSTTAVKVRFIIFILNSTKTIAYTVHLLVPLFANTIFHMSLACHLFEREL